MIQIKENKDCCGCNSCVQRCPKHCIGMLVDSEGFLYPKIDESLCIDCGLCEKVCPVINQGESHLPLKVFAAKNPDWEVRRQSSSGGIFTMLAERTIEHGGVVFGAAFNKKWEVEHQYTETKEGLAAFRSSKYVQSHIGETFKQAEIFLKQGREVLFSGTPCQIAALRFFLRKEYDNLLMVDFICHGVPSPEVFRTYLKEEKQNFAFNAKKNIVSSRSIYYVSEESSSEAGDDGVEIEGISFRDKCRGWGKYSFTIVFSKLTSDGKKDTVSFSCPNYENSFMQGFHAGLYLRPSCYACPTKELKSGSDITMGDYWGISSLIPELDDDRGISAIIVNTEKGNQVVHGVGAELYPAYYDDIRQKNPAIYRSLAVPVKRKDFFCLDNETFVNRVTKLCKRSLGARVKCFIMKYFRVIFHKVVMNKLSWLKK